MAPTILQHEIATLIAFARNDAVYEVLFLPYRPRSDNYIAALLHVVRKLHIFAQLNIYMTMKRVVTIMALSATLIACGGANKNNDKNSDRKATLSQSIGATDTAKGTVNESDNIATLVANYNEMALSALENSDARTFMSIMEQMEAWQQGLDSEHQALAERLTQEWREENKERVDRVYENAIMLSPHMVKHEAQSAR